MGLDYTGEKTVILCMGVSEYGKSTFTVRYLLNAHYDCVFIFDLDDEYSDRLLLRPAYTPEELNAACLDGWCCFDPKPTYGGNLEKAINDFCEFAVRKSEELPGKKLLVIDELWRYCGPNKIPSALVEAIQGRKKGLGVLLNTQQPNSLPSTVRNEATEIVCFCLQDENAFDVVKRTPFSLDPEEISRLPKLHFVARNLKGGGMLRGVLSF